VLLAVGANVGDGDVNVGVGVASGSEVGVTGVGDGADNGGLRNCGTLLVDDGDVNTSDDDDDGGDVDVDCLVDDDVVEELVATGANVDVVEEVSSFGCDC
jgi:hypothetical protein